MSKTCFSLFSGAGGSDCGMIAAGYTSSGGIEYHQPAADIYNLNHKAPVTVVDILSIEKIPTVDLLWCSPPCPSFSIANTNRGETQKDLELGYHLATLIRGSKPRSIAIENVRGYAKSKSLSIILSALEDLGYEVRQSIECAANYGAPTTRERLIVRASLDPISPMVHTHQKASNQLGLFSLPTWVSWWDAIEDRIEELPISRLTDNQIKALIQKNITAPLLVNGDGNNYQSSYTTRRASDPAPTVTSSIAKHPMRILVDTCNTRSGRYTTRSNHEPSYTITRRHGESTSYSRLLIERVGYYNGSPNTYEDNLPSPTIRSAQHIDDKGSYRVAYNILDRYDCYAADIKCLAAWQSFPADYNWGKNRGEAGRAIGNAVPCKLSEAVAKSFSIL